MTTTLTFRPLRLRDALFCWRLASDPVVREASVDRRRPTVLGHVRWMREWTRGRDGMAWIVERMGEGQMMERVGLVRAEPLANPRGSEISIALVPAARGRGIGTEALRLVTQRVAAVIGKPVHARVRGGNAGSAHAFMKAGYAIGQNDLDDYTWFRWVPPTLGGI